MNTKMTTIESIIKAIKKELLEIGEMRPGSLTLQKRAGSKEGAYYQLSYTHDMKGHTEYVRGELAPDIRKQIANYKRFRKLVARWVRLAMEHSKIKMELAKRKLMR